MSRLVWEMALVERDGDGRRWLRFDKLSSCQRCLSGQGCGAGVFSRLFARGHARLAMPPGRFFKPGQRVRVGIPSSTLVLMAMLLYGLPLGGFLLAATLGHWLFALHSWRDLGALVLGLTGAALGLVPAVIGHGPRLNPRIEVLSCNESAATLESAVD
ncbi:MAG: SoxR reducing system RseC family protein [Wenzhouxiangella sp.]|nr:SoxR reducing system RseC family protein [Wenzhouxiangella sp.]